MACLCDSCVNNSAACKDEKCAYRHPDGLPTKPANGWRMDRVPFSEVARKVLEVAIDHRRQGLKLPDDALRGTRFNDDGAVLARLESAYTEAEFMACPGLRIDSALLDAAQSDYWYTTEKDWGRNETAEIEIADED